MPIVIGALLLALIEDYLVPEEYSTKKIYDKTIQMIVLVSFLYFLNSAGVTALTRLSVHCAERTVAISS